MKLVPFVVGALCAVLLTLALTVAVPRPAFTQASTIAAARYQIVFSPRTERNTYLLDTATGRTWAQVTFTDLNGEPTVWVLVDRIDADSDRLRVINRYGTKGSASR